MIFPGEDEDLKIHANLCAQRYEQLEARIQKIEVKLDGISQEIIKNKADLTKVLIGATSTLMAGLLGLITTIIMKF